MRWIHGWLLRLDKLELDSAISIGREIIGIGGLELDWVSRVEKTIAGVGRRVATFKLPVRLCYTCHGSRYISGWGRGTAIVHDHLPSSREVFFSNLRVAPWPLFRACLVGRQSFFDLTAVNFETQLFSWHTSEGVATRFVLGWAIAIYLLQIQKRNLWLQLLSRDEERILKRFAFSVAFSLRSRDLPRRLAPQHHRLSSLQKNWRFERR